jgi:hypothetical protein
MNYNILSYTIFSLITIYIIIWVGRLFHRNGRIFILSFFQNKEELTDTTNNLLLTGYYLFNIGYAIIQFSYWKKIETIADMLSSTLERTGILILILAFLHYNNMLIIYVISNYKKNKHTTKN